MAASISTSVIACLRSFNEFIVEIQRIPSQESRVLELDTVVWEDELGRLRMWAANIGAHQTGQSSLDFRLRESSHISEQIVKLLEDLLSRLQDARDVLSEYGEVANNDDFTSQVSDDEDTTEVQELRESVATIINGLFQMSMLVRKPAKHDMIMGSKRSEVAMFEPFDYNHVRDKYPRADDSIIKRLGSAVTRRRKHLKYRERHALKLKQGINKIVPEIRATHGVRDGETVAEGTTSLLSDTIATDIKALNIRFDDAASESGASQTSYAETLMGSGHITIPRPPKSAQDGSPFECPYCHFIVTIKATGSWNRHVFQDLQPYICIVENCTTPETLYTTRREWLHHLKTAHAADSTLNTVKGSVDPNFSCPLCKECIHNEKSYDRHVARHLQELALFILPRVDEDSDDDHENHDHSDTESIVNSIVSSEDPLDAINSMNSRVLADIEDKIVARKSDFDNALKDIRNNATSEQADKYGLRDILENFVWRLEMLNCSDHEQDKHRRTMLTLAKNYQVALGFWKTKGSLGADPTNDVQDKSSRDVNQEQRDLHHCESCGFGSILINRPSPRGEKMCPRCHKFTITIYNVSGPPLLQNWRVSSFCSLIPIYYETPKPGKSTVLKEDAMLQVLQKFDTPPSKSDWWLCRTQDGSEGFVSKKNLYRAGINPADSEHEPRTSDSANILEPIIEDTATERTETSPRETRSVNSISSFSAQRYLNDPDPDPLPCSECSRTFVGPDRHTNRQRHSRDIHPKIPLICQICRENFSRSTDLTRHIFTMHQPARERGEEIGSPWDFDEEMKKAVREAEEAEETRLKALVEEEESLRDLDPDIIILKFKGKTYPLHFPAFSLTEFLEISELRRQAAREIKCDNPRRVKLLYKGRSLRDDSKTCREEGLKQNSELLCVVAGDPISIEWERSPSTSTSETNEPATADINARDAQDLTD